MSNAVLSQAPLLEARNICKSYQQGGGDIQVLSDVNIQIQPREMTAIVGASGSGKTTLLQILGTLDGVDSGQILFQGKELTTLSESKLAAHRNTNIGFIFQFHHLLPEFTALENIMMPGLIKGLDKQELQADAHELLEKIGLKQRADHRSGELSGGEQQRIALARSLVLKPSLLLADEPTGNLDSASGEMVFGMLQELTQTISFSVVMVTHNMELARQMDNCLTLQDGTLS
ncbi:MAG: ABC transporter ATP-binding protein [Desulfobulbus propionicus]|nr:MAG: ABC transporter ATP-binding protein [Desulfobulbus propionicus]